jgi:hypothetical protein
MARREWPLRFVCAHEGCNEAANYRYATRRDLMESFELKHYSNGRWRCTRHARPSEVLSATNPRTRAELTVEQKPHGRYFGSFGFIHGPGFKAFADDFPPGAKVIVSAELVVPATASVDTHPQGGDPAQTGAPFMSGAVPAEERADAQTLPVLSTRRNPDESH